MCGTEKKCSHKSVGPTNWIKDVSAVANDSTGFPVHKGTDSESKTLRNAACIYLRAYQMSFGTTGLDVYGSHFYLI